jgi:hypothetical protein
MLPAGMPAQQLNAFVNLVDRALSSFHRLHHVWAKGEIFNVGWRNTYTVCSAQSDSSQP